MSVAISIKNLTKTYATGFEALKGISLEVNQGDFFALLGQVVQRNRLDLPQVICLLKLQNQWHKF